MSKTHFRPYISNFELNLHAFEFVGLAQDRRTGQQFRQIGKQSPSFAATISLYLGPKDAPIDVGRQQYTFTDVATRPTQSHSGLPPMADILTPQVLSAWLQSIDEVIDEQLPFYRDESSEAAAAGPEGYIRPNRIEVSLPFERPENHSIHVICGLYEDKEFTRQTVNAQIVVSFVTDEYAKRVYRETISSEEPTVAQLAQFKAGAHMFDLAGFVQQPAIQSGIGVVAANLYSTLKAKVPQYANVDVATIMQEFAATLQKTFPSA